MLQCYSTFKAWCFGFLKAFLLVEPPTPPLTGQILIQNQTQVTSYYYLFFLSPSVTIILLFWLSACISMITGWIAAIVINNAVTLLLLLVTLIVLLNWPCTGIFYYGLFNYFIVEYLIIHYLRLKVSADLYTLLNKHILNKYKQNLTEPCICLL